MVLFLWMMYLMMVFGVVVSVVVGVGSVDVGFLVVVIGLVVIVVVVRFDSDRLLEVMLFWLKRVIDRVMVRMMGIVIIYVG